MLSSITLQAAARNVPERNRLMGKKGASTTKFTEAHRECEVTDEIFATTGAAPCLGMCEAFAGDLHDSRITSHKSTCAQPRPTLES